MHKFNQGQSFREAYLDSKDDDELVITAEQSIADWVLLGGAVNLGIDE